MKNYTAIFTMTILSLIFLTSADKAFAAPPNDNFAGALPLVLQNGTVGVTTNNSGATKQAGEPHHAENVGGKSVWFSFTPTTTKLIRINTVDNNFDTLLAVYTGSAVNNLTPVGYNDDCNTACGQASTVDLMMSAGTTYYIAVDGLNDSGTIGEGNFKIVLLELDAPIQDNLNSAYPLGFSFKGSIGGTNFNATREAAEPTHYSSSLSGAKSIWYRWSPSGSFSAKIELTENYNSVLAVYSSNSAAPTFAQLNPVAQSYDQHGFTDSRYRVKFFAEAGKHYFIAVAGNNSNNATPEGNFQLKWGVSPLRYSADYERYDDNSAISVFRPSDGGWHSVYSFALGLTASVQWGQSGDTPVAADYDGNGSTDIAVARNENGVKNWYIRNAAGISGLTWGLATDRAITGDYDGDGKADVGTMRLTANGYAWYIRRSSNGALKTFQFGTTGDKPVFGDFDGDGMTEVAVVRNTQNGIVWYMLKSSTNYTQFSAQQFGTTPDVPAAEDFDGDGRTDIAIFRPSTGYWYILQSSNGALDYKVFGTSGDKPQPADYDGDGKADVCVYRPSNGTWYILRSSNGQPIVRQWGAATDIPVSSMTTLSQ